MMRTLAAFVAGAGLAMSLAFATGTSTLSVKVRDILTTIDTVPTKVQLDHAFDGEALPNLALISQDTTIDIGVRVRAIHALAKYCPDPCSTGELAHESLTALIHDTRHETIGEPVVLLRAAIETIGTLRVSTDSSMLLGLGLLDHTSRDIRAATARALRDLCNNQAVIPLRVRYAIEPTNQVKLAISEALRIIGQCDT